MKLRFYFDYSDYRSYLMMHSLQVLRALPVRIQWIALDAYSLRAMTGCDLPCPKKRDFMKQEALRFCQREHIDFVWQNEPFHNGSALRAGAFMMAEQNSLFDVYSRQVLELLWARGQNVDAAAIKDILQTLNVDFDGLAARSSEHELFQIQDACLQEAMADGVFDIPAVVIGDNLVCHFDQAQEILRLVLIECLRSASPELILDAMASQMLSMPSDDMLHLLAFVTNQQKTPADTAPVGDNISGVIQYSLPQPDSTWHIEKTIPKTAVTISVSDNACPDLFAELNALAENSIRICLNDALDLPDEPVIPEKLPPSALFLALGRHKKTRSLFCLSVDSQSKPCICQHLNAEQDFVIARIADWTIAVLPESVSLDPNMARLASLRGVNCLIRMHSQAGTPISEAFAYLADAWVLEVSENSVSVIDPRARRMSLSSALVLTAALQLPDAKSWLPPAPRTLLLFEKSLSFGELAENADIELACRGMNLIVSTAQQSSELSSTRSFDKIRIHNDNLILMPIYSEQVLVTELVSHRLIQMINQAPRDAMPILVNYWSELEFERLEMMRPVFALIAVMFQIPVVIVVSSQVAEIWLSTPQRTPWRVEREDAAYAIDTAELLRTGQCFHQLLGGLQLSESTFLNRLALIDAASHQDRPRSFL